MSDPIEGEAAAAEADAPEVVAADAGEVEAKAAEPNPRGQIDDAAKSSGWAPKDQWKGDPKDWLDAPEFILKAAGEILPSMRRTLNESKTEIAQLRKTLKDFGEHHNKTEARAYERAAKDIQARLDEAAANGDVQGVRDATDELVDLRTEAKTPKAEDTEAATTDPAFDEWVEANAWWTKDKVMTAAAIAIANDVEATEGLIKGPRFYAEVDKRLRAEMPHKFKNPRREEPGAVEAPNTARRTATKTFNDLPADAKAMCIEFERDIKGFKRDTYVKDYFG